MLHLRSCAGIVGLQKAEGSYQQVMHLYVPLSMTKDQRYLQPEVYLVA